MSKYEDVTANGHDTASRTDMDFDRDVLEDLLLSKAGQVGVELSLDQAKRIIDHLDLVLQKNKVFNLTRIVTPEDAIIRHCVDSLRFYKTLLDYDNKPIVALESSNFLDIGTGAGYPGIPFAIVSGMSGVLLDSVHKKANAVSEFIEQLSLSDKLVAKATRVEEFAINQPRSFSIVLARAVAKQGILVEYASPLLSKGGYFISSKANITDEEVDNADRVAKLTGMKLVSREMFELPDDAGHREIFIYQKVKDPKLRLPRKNGMAKSKPLWER